MSSGLEPPLVYKAVTWIIGGLLSIVGFLFWQDKKSKDKDLSDLWDKREEDIRKSVELETKQKYLESEHRDMKDKMDKMAVQVQDVQTSMQSIASDVKTILAIQKYQQQQDNK